MKRLIILLLLLPIVQAKAYTSYPPPFQYSDVDMRERLTTTHFYSTPVVSQDRFLEDALHPGSSTVRWTTAGAYSVTLDKVHLARNSYTLIIKTRYGFDIRMLPFETTKVYLAPDYYGVHFDKETNTVWLAKYAR